MSQSPQDDYVTLKDKAGSVKCHHRGISRLRSEELLLAAKEDGSFLLRDSETIPGAYTLCLVHQGRVHQYRVLPGGGAKLYVQAERGVQERKFSDLGQLVQDYLQRGGRNGLVCALKHPVEVQETIDDDSEDEDEDDSRQRSMGAPSIPAGCTPRSPPSATSSGSSVGSNTSLDKPQRPIPNSRSVTTLDYHGGSPGPSSGSNTPGSVHSTDRIQHTTPRGKDSSPSHSAGSDGVPMSGAGWSDRDNDYVEDFALENNPVRRYVMSRFTQLDLSSCSGSFPTNLREYVESGVFKDSNAVNSGEDTLHQLRRLLAVEAKDLDRQLEAFLVKIDALRQLFGPITTTALAGSKCTNTDSLDLETVLNRFVSCKSAILKLEKKAAHRLLGLVSDDNQPSVEEKDAPPGYAPPALPKQGPIEPPVIPSSSFDAKILKPGKLGASSKITLKVDIHAGKLYMVRPSKDVLDSNSMVHHDKVLQLIKSTVNNSRLDIRIDGRKGKDTIVFDNLRQRESFCQLMQQMKFIHSSHQEVDRLSIFVGTWNMGDSPMPKDIRDWLQCQGTGKSRDSTLAVLAHDLYVIGSQESGLTEKEFVHKIQRALSECVKTDLQLLTSSTLWSIRVVVLVKPEYKNKITHIQQSTVKTGIANALGNKGASAVSFSFNGTSFCFINCHLTSGWEKNHRRNQNLRDIIKGLNLGSKSLNLFDVTNQFHHVFVLGDLNYRIHGMDSTDIIRRIQSCDYEELQGLDQLKNSQMAAECLIDFTEEEISFPPTYRIARGRRDKYEWQKFKKTGVRINAPSWCDRVLWRSYPETYIINTSYGCVEDIFTSDHKPVFSSFDVGIINQFAGTNSVQARGSTGDVRLIFEDVYAQLKTSTKDNFKLEFYSTCLEGSVISNQNYRFNNPPPGYTSPHWSHSNIPNLIPLVDDRDYLEDQHILIAVKSADGMESYGECVLALKSMFAIRAQPFHVRLTHQGENTGELQGKMYVKCKDDQSQGRGRRSYELIYMDTDKLFQEMESLRHNPETQLYTTAEEKGPYPAPHKPVSKTTSLPRGVCRIEKEHARSSSPVQHLAKLDSMLAAANSGSNPDVSAVKNGTRQKDMYESIWLRSPVNPGLPTKPNSDGMETYDKATSPPKVSLKKLAESMPPKPDLKALPRKPRLGQSSLSPGNVLPVTSDRVSPKMSTASLPMAGADPTQLDYEVVTHSFDPCERDAVARKTSKEGSPGLPDCGAKPKAPLTKQYSDPLVQDNPFYVDSGGKKPSGKPWNLGGMESHPSEPLSPEYLNIKEVKQSLLFTQESCDYETLRPPSSVDQWLTDLGLPQYIPGFHAQGWDQLEFITDLSHEDLLHMEISNAEHRSMIIASIQNLEFSA